MFDAALKSPLNKDDVQPAYEKYIKPILKLKGNLWKYVQHQKNLWESIQNQRKSMKLYTKTPNEYDYFNNIHIWDFIYKCFNDIDSPIRTL